MMTKEEKREIRRVLLGKTLLQENGRLTSMGPGDRRLPLGIGDGAGAVRFLGVGGKSRRLETKLREPAVKNKAAEIMKDIGRGLDLREQPDTVACLIRYVLTRPALLTFRYMEGVPVLTAWAGRGLTGWISRRRALRAFRARLPESIKISEKQAPAVEPPKEKKQKKSRRERKAEKLAAREQAAAKAAESSSPKAGKEQQS
ncbi:MAG: hypothetical protein IKS05_04605 [Oscillospiraceae bacterium]|nr:hypothetical protein [Oscillospiraceae bacterium]MBR6377029.1 hypothetical protein [Oscillospiraceae bacterium]